MTIILMSHSTIKITITEIVSVMDLHLVVVAKLHLVDACLEMVHAPGPYCVSSGASLGILIRPEVVGRDVVLSMP